MASSTNKITKDILNSKFIIQFKMSEDGNWHQYTKGTQPVEFDNQFQAEEFARKHVSEIKVISHFGIFLHRKVKEWKVER